MSAVRVLQGYAADTRQKGLPLFAVCLLAWAVDLATTHGLGVPRGWARFMVWNALYTMGWQYGVKRRCGSLREALYVLCGNTLTFAVCAAARAHVSTPGRAWCVPMVFGLVTGAWEYGHFYLSERDWGRHVKNTATTTNVPPQKQQINTTPPTATAETTAAPSSAEAAPPTSALAPRAVYTIRQSPNAMDNLFLPIVMVVLFVVSRQMHFDVSLLVSPSPSPPLLNAVSDAAVIASTNITNGGGGDALSSSSSSSIQQPQQAVAGDRMEMMLFSLRLFAAFVPIAMIEDTTFGIIHLLSHRVGSLWRKHQRHHEYRGHDLNTFANGHAEFFDGLFMSGVFAITNDALRRLRAAFLVRPRVRHPLQRIPPHVRLAVFEYDAVVRRGHFGRCAARDQVGGVPPRPPLGPAEFLWFVRHLVG